MAILHGMKNNKAMKIVHLCLGGPFSDGWNYQENLLTKYHSRLGWQVTVICSQWQWNNSGQLELCESTGYYNADGVKIIRLKMRHGTIQSKFKRYRGLFDAIDAEKPDIIFQHGVAYIDNSIVAKYCRSHPKVCLYVDNHADFSNSAQNWLSKNILHKVIWKKYAKIIEPYVQKFYGVLPARVDFMQKMYSIPPEKCELLIMGADDELVEKASRPEVKESVRTKYGIAQDDFLIVTGGKIDQWKKQTLLLMNAVQRIESDLVKLIVFGAVSPDLVSKVNELADGEKVQFIGWIEAKDSYAIFAAADLVVFPGRHSVFWEQVAGQGIPMLVKEWKGTNHVDLGGNVEFLSKDSVDEIQMKVERLFNDKKRYARMRNVAREKGMAVFSYKRIAQRAIQSECDKDD